MMGGRKHNGYRYNTEHWTEMTKRGMDEGGRGGYSC